MKHPQKRTVYLHGIFKEKYHVESIEVYADSIFNLFNIIFKCVFPTFLNQEKYFNISFETEDGEMTDLIDPEQELSPEQTKIHIIPNTDGAIGLSTLIIISIITTILSIGIALLLAPKMDSSQDTTSGANWGTPENVVGQGGTIPVVLGKRLVGSRVASYGIDSIIYEGRGNG